MPQDFCIINSKYFRLRKRICKRECFDVLVFIMKSEYNKNISNLVADYRYLLITSFQQGGVLYLVRLCVIKSEGIKIRENYK